MTRRRTTPLTSVDLDDTERLLDRPEVCERLRIGKTKFYALINSGDLTAVLEGDEIRVRVSDLNAHIRDLPLYVPRRAS